MKRIIPILLAVFCAAVFAGVADDGVISEGEYDYGIIKWTSYNPPLIVEGGGANLIEVRNYGRLEVRYTSTPVTDSSGIWDILLDGDSQLLYLGGETEEVTIYDRSIVELYGGRIDAITSMQYAATKHINLYCRPDWSWIWDGQQKVGITGLWENNDPFSIDLINDTDYDPVWMNINVVEVPEPVTLALVGLGGLLIRRKK